MGGNASTDNSFCAILSVSLGPLSDDSSYFDLFIGAGLGSFLVISVIISCAYFSVKAKRKQEKSISPPSQTEESSELATFDEPLRPGIDAKDSTLRASLLPPSDPSPYPVPNAAHPYQGF
jgi:hypothetical protein